MKTKANNQLETKVKKRRRAKRRDQILALALHPGLKTQKEIAQVVGVSDETVSRVLTANRGTLDEINQALTEYQRILPSMMPVSDRAAALVAVARQVDDPKTLMAALKALERIDDLSGVVTERDKMRVKLLNTEPVAPQPMFMLPAGSRIQVTRGQNPQIEVKAADSEPIIDSKE